MKEAMTLAKNKEKIKIAFISLGCAKNQVDLEKLAGSMREARFEFVDDLSMCDVAIVNTCGFIKEAVSEAIDAILSTHKDMPEDSLLLVFGCMSERYKGEFANELPEVDFFAGVGEEAMQSLLNYIVSKKGGAPLVLSDNRYLFNPPYYAYLKIAEGCNHRCSFCTIPSIRGNYRSFSMDSILKEAAELVRSGVKEIIVISQDSTKYGSDLKIGVDFADLISSLSRNHPDIYFRIMYLNPDGITEKLIDVVANNENIIKYFDIPVQHGSDNILKQMNRHYNIDSVQKLFSHIRRKIPNAFIRTTFIVGFPGETEEDFNATMSFITDHKPDYAGFFPYSKEDGTRAALMEDIVPDKVINSRMKALQKVQKKNTLQKINSFKDKEIICFVENKNEDFDFILEGRSLFQAPEIDGKLFVLDGIASKGNGPYKALIRKVSYPDVYVELTGEAS